MVIFQNVLKLIKIFTKMKYFLDISIINKGTSQWELFTNNGIDNATSLILRQLKQLSEITVKPSYLAHVKVTKLASCHS